MCGGGLCPGQFQAEETPDRWHSKGQGIPREVGETDNGDERDERDEPGEPEEEQKVRHDYPQS